MSEKRPPGTTSTNVARNVSKSDEINAFVRQARAAMVQSAGQDAGRLTLAMDATMSRQPSWDLAVSLQAQMFDAVGKAGSLNVQLVYFRGLGECRASKFVSDTASLKNLMTKITCQGGQTQIGKVLAHALAETAKTKINALVYIGDAMEENVDELSEKAGRLGLHGTPIFIFQEGRDPAAESAFKEIARLSKGAWFRFDQQSASTLAKLLATVAVYATGGLKALEQRGTPHDRLMIENLRGSGQK